MTARGTQISQVRVELPQPSEGADRHEWAQQMVARIHELQDQLGHALGSAQGVGVVHTAGAPTAADLEVGTARIVKDTVGGGVSLCYNDAGTLRSVALL